MYAMQVSTNDRNSRQDTLVKALFGMSILELADRVEEQDALAVANWMRRNHELVEQYLDSNPDETFFCGDNGRFRYDVQLAD